MRSSKLYLLTKVFEGLQSIESCHQGLLIRYPDRNQILLNDNRIVFKAIYAVQVHDVGAMHPHKTTEGQFGHHPFHGRINGVTLVTDVNPDVIRHRLDHQNILDFQAN